MLQQTFQVCEILNVCLFWDIYIYDVKSEEQLFLLHFMLKVQKYFKDHE